jgi:hypothetical protein
MDSSWDSFSALPVKLRFLASLNAQVRSVSLA